MKIKEARNAVITKIITDEEEFYEYTRYSPSNWLVTMGASEEPVMDCEELEKLFQEYVTQANLSLKDL